MIETHAPRIRQETTLEDVHDALAPLQLAYSLAAPEVRERARAEERADAAMVAHVLGARSRAVEDWTRLRLELEGADTETALLAACLRLEIVDDDPPTRRLRGFYSNGGFGAPIALRVRAQFPLPELAGRAIERARVWVEFVDGLNPWSGPGDPRRATVALVFDDRGRMAPVTSSIPFGPTGLSSGVLQLCFDGVAMDSVDVENGWDAEKRRRDWFQRAGLGRHGEASSMPAPTTEGEGALMEARRRCFVARVGLLTASADSERSAEFLVDLNALPLGVDERSVWFSALTRALPREADAVRNGMAGGPPLSSAARSGPVWRTFALDGARDVSAWVQLPPHSSGPHRGMIVALQPEGFDEGWFVELAGGGALFAHGPAAGFTVVALDTGQLAADPALGAAVLESLDRELPGGPVHLVAAGRAASIARHWAAMFPERVAGVVHLPAGRGGAPVRVLGLEAELRAAVDAWGE